MTSNEVLMKESAIQLENYVVVAFDENGKAFDKPYHGYVYYKSIQGRLELHYECSHESIIDPIVEQLNQPAAEDMKAKTMDMIMKLCSKCLAAGRELVSFDFNLDQIDYDVVSYFCKTGLLFYIWDPNLMPFTKSKFSNLVLEWVMSLDHFELRATAANMTSINLIFSSSLLQELLQKLRLVKESKVFNRGLSSRKINDPLPKPVFLSSLELEKIVSSSVRHALEQVQMLYDKDLVLEFSYDCKCNQILVRNLKKQGQEFLIKGLKSGSKQALMASDLFNGKEIHGLKNEGSSPYNTVRKLNQYFNLNSKLFKRICSKQTTSNWVKYKLEKRSITLAEIKTCPKYSDGYLITNSSGNRDSNRVLVFDDKGMSLLQVAMEFEKAL